MALHEALKCYNGDHETHTIVRDLAGSRQLYGLMLRAEVEALLHQGQPEVARSRQLCHSYALAEGVSWEFNGPALDEARLDNFLSSAHSVCLHSHSNEMGWIARLRDLPRTKAVPGGEAHHLPSKQQNSSFGRLNTKMII